MFRWFEILLGSIDGNVEAEIPKGNFQICHQTRKNTHRQKTTYIEKEQKQTLPRMVYFLIQASYILHQIYKWRSENCDLQGKESCHWPSSIQTKEKTT